MSTIQVRREHDLGQQASKELAEKLLNKLIEKFGGKYSPDGDNFRYKHTAGVNAVVEPLEDEISINVKLGIMARGFAPQLEQEMNRALDRYFS